MELGERIKKIRRSLGHTQQEFANILNLKRQTIAAYETGAVLPSDRTISDICREFNASESWLRTGDGEPFLKIDNDDLELQKVFAQITTSDDELIKRIIRSYWSMNEKEKAIIRKLIDGFSSK